MSRPARALLERPQALPPLSRMLMGLTMAVLGWETRRRTRGSLEKLDDHLLDDIGIGRRDAIAESGKPFWQD